VAGLAALIAYAHMTHRPIPAGPTAANAGITIFGALAGSIIVALIVRPRWENDGPAQTRPAYRRAALVMPVLAAVGFRLALPGVPLPSIDRPGSLTTAQTEQNSNDIPEPECVVAAIENAGSAKFTLFSIDLGPTFSYGRKELADSSVEVEVAVGMRAGFTLSIGGGLGAKLAAYVGAKASLSADGTLTVISTFDAGNDAKADDIIRWALARYGLSALALPGLASWMTPHVDTLAPSPDPEAPQQSTLNLEGELQFAADAGSIFHVHAELGAGTSVAVVLAADKNHKNTDPAEVTDPTNVSVEFGLSASGGGSAALAPIGGGLSLDFEGEAAASVDFAKEHVPWGYVWVPDQAGLDLTAALHVSDLSTVDSDLPRGDDSGQPAVAEGTKKVGLSLQETKAVGASLQISDEVKGQAETALVSADVIRVIGTMQSSNGSDTGHLAAVNQLANDINKYGELRAEFYKVDTGSLELGVSEGEGITFGASADFETTMDTLIVAMIRPPGGSLSLSHACPGVGGLSRDLSGWI
jgi:hypothetical protein